MLPKSLDGLTFGDVVEMVGAGLREGRTLDLKQAPVGGRDEDKREFLADVSALANTAGGDIVFGITEAQGEATGVPGIVLADPDQEILRLTSVLRAGLEPRLPKVDLSWLPGTQGSGLLIVRAPRSYLGPHRVTFRDHAKFYGRTNAGKAPLDVAELRSAFLASEGLHQSIRRFRSERLAVIEAEEGPVSVGAAAKAVLHLFPLEAFATERHLEIDRNKDRLVPIGASDAMRARHTIEGFAAFAGRLGGPDGDDDYALLFRTGVIESACLVGLDGSDGWAIPASNVEYGILSVFADYRRRLIEKEVSLPVYVCLSLIGVRGYHLHAPQELTRRRHSLRTDALVLPETIISDAQQTDEEVLRPLFDRMYNAFGFERSTSFDTVAAQVRR